MAKKFKGGWRKRNNRQTPELALKLHDKDGKSYRVIAEEWGVSPALIQKLIQKAKRNAAIVPPELQTHTNNLTEG